MEGQLISSIEHNGGNIRIYKSDKKSTQKDIDDFYKLIAELLIRNEKTA